MIVGAVVLINKLGIGFVLVVSPSISNNSSREDFAFVNLQTIEPVPS